MGWREIKEQRKEGNREGEREKKRGEKEEEGERREGRNSDGYMPHPHSLSHLPTHDGEMV